MQNKEGYGPYRVRTALVPVVNFGSRLAMPLVLIGILLDTYVRTANPDTGFYVAMVGVVLYGGSFLFSLVTLPVELDASRRAGEMLLAAGVIAGLVAFLGALTFFFCILPLLLCVFTLNFYPLPFSGIIFRKKASLIVFPCFTLHTDFFIFTQFFHCHYHILKYLLASC